MNDTKVRQVVKDTKAKKFRRRETVEQQVEHIERRLRVIDQELTAIEDRRRARREARYDSATPTRPVVY